MKKQYLLLIVVAGLLTFFSACKNEAIYKTLIITGQNNHNWKASSPILKQILDETGMFTAEIMTSPEKGGDMNTFNPDFSKYILLFSTIMATHGQTKQILHSLNMLKTEVVLWFIMQPIIHSRHGKSITK